MDQKQQLELDAWIAEHVMGWKESDIIKRPAMIPSFCSDPAAAMVVLKKCAEKCGINGIVIEPPVGGVLTDWFVAQNCTAMIYHAPTIELAICLFAKGLFSHPCLSVSIRG